MSSKIYGALCAAFFLAAAVACAEKLDAPGEAEQNSTHILIGKLIEVYSRITRDAINETSHYIAKVRVESVEKGAGVNPGECVHVRYWRNTKSLHKGMASIGPNGHQNIPEEGQRRRMCLVKNNDGLFDVYYVSGFKSPDGKAP